MLVFHFFLKATCLSFVREDNGHNTYFGVIVLREENERFPCLYSEIRAIILMK